MTDSNQPSEGMQSSTNIGAGFEEEASKLPPVKKPEKQTKSEEMKRNLSAVFGHGPGKIAIIAVGILLVVLSAFAYRGITAPPPAVKDNSRIDVVRAPAPQISTAPISKEEAERRALVAQKEAEEAKAKGKGYQTTFEPKVVDNNQNKNDPPSPKDGNPATKIEVAIEAGQGGNTPKTPAEAQQADREERAHKAALDEREKKINAIRTELLKQINDDFEMSHSGQKQINNSYSKVSYSGAKLQRTNTPITGTKIAAQDGSIERADTQKFDDVSGTDKKRKLLIKTAERVYAELDSEINTDDGREVFATIRGGKWNGAAVIGQVVQQPNNVSLKFTTLAPSDQRPTMKINAVALRLEDGKLGMADKIEHHTLSRYAALGFSSLLGGAGKAYAQPVGTSVITNGQVVTTTSPPTDRQIIGAAIGELGTAAATEIRRGFDKPPTYSTPAQKGFIIYFVQDIYEPTSGN